MIEVDWRVAFIYYIEEHKLSPSVDQKALKLPTSRRSKGYILAGGNLYKHGSV
jgi:hypothetical protein